MTPAEIITRYNRAIIDKSAEALAALYAEDAVHETPFSHGAPIAGRTALRDTYAKAWGEAPVTVRGIRDVVVHEASDGAVVVEESIDLTNSETGADFTAATVLVMRVADGLIAHMRDYTDNLTIARALGRVPAIAG